MREEGPDNGQSAPPREDRDSMWSIPLGRRALYFGLFTTYALAGIGFLLWYEIFEHTADTWPQTVLFIMQGIGINTVGAAGLALLSIEGPENVMVVADYLRKKLIEPLEEKRRIEAERRREEAAQRREEAAQRREEAAQRRREEAEQRREEAAQRRQEEAEQRREQARAEAEERVKSIQEASRAEGLAEGEARRQAEWVAWNERRMAHEARGEPFDEPPPELPGEPKRDDAEPPPETSSTEGE